MYKTAIITILSLFFFNLVKSTISGVPNYIFPSETLLIFMGLPIYLSFQIEQYLNKVISFFWILFFYVGNINVINSFSRNVNYDLKVEETGWIFIIFLTSYIIAVLFMEKILQLKKITIQKPLNDNLINIFLIVFPFIWFISVYRSVGFLPILAGKDITSNMYTLDYGPLHGFQLVIVFGMLSVFDKYLTTSNNKYLKIILILTIFIFLFILMFDGRRYIILLGCVSLYTLYVVRAKEFFLSKKIVLYLVIVAFIYTIGLLLRTGASKLKDGISYLSQVFPFGDEYRDFVYSVNHFQPGKVKGYDFIGSTFGSIMNSQMLKLFDLDKQKLVESGSAHIWMKLYNINFGIRTGIISELYFAFDYWGIIFIMLLGFISTYITKNLLNTKSTISQYSLIIMYSLIMFAIMGQFTSIVGPFTTIFYVWLVNKITLKFTNFKET